MSSQKSNAKTEFEQAYRNLELYSGLLGRGRFRITP